MLPLKSKIFLFPYWMTLNIRHFLYDKNIKKSYGFDVPVICVGNITVGGTGKTPFTEMLLRVIEYYNPQKYELMVLSRGYRRKTKGFVVVGANDDYSKVGDEPLQIKMKFPNVVVAVCEKRKVGIVALIKMFAESGSRKLPVIILDDAFQHRQVVPRRSVVLMNFNNPVCNDNLLPFGRLRDLPEQIKRAQDIVVTNSPFYFSGEEYVDDELATEFVSENISAWSKSLKLRQDQNLYFAATFYKDAKPVFADIVDNRYVYSKQAVCFSGIANDAHFANHVSENYKVLDSLIFPDHCKFGRADVSNINKLVKKYPLAAIFTTEKDSVRLVNNKYLSKEVKHRLFYIPIETRILSLQKEKSFVNGILE